MKIEAVIAAISIAALLCGCQPERYTRDYFGLFDTHITVAGYAWKEEAFEQPCESLRAKLQTLHQLFDIYQNYEGLVNLKTVNDRAGQAPVAVAPEIMDLLALGKFAYEETGGAVNIALGAVTELWRQYREAALADPAAAALPPPELLAEALRHTNPADIVLDRTAGTVYLRDPALRLDVGALAKGYAAGLARDAARDAGLAAGILNAGGNVCAWGAPPGRRAWNVGVQDPFNPEALWDVLPLGEVSAVTSGDYQRVYQVGGVAYHHIIDPATARPASRHAAVTVLHGDSAVADLLSTALFILPVEEGKKLLDKYNAGALWVFPDKGSEGYGLEKFLVE
jgi:thiamine biosynthesis lipoprotein